MKPVVYLDFDGVLFNFEGKALELFGPNWKKEIERPEWGDFAKYPNWFDLLEPLPDALELYEGCCEITGDKNLVQGLTALPHRAAGIFATAAQDKIRSAHRHISKDFRTHFGPFAADKQYHVKHEHDILVDDMKRNIVQWTMAGGIGVWHKNAKQSLDEIAHAYNMIRRM